jgi:hypothetical protein
MSIEIVQCALATSAPHWIRTSAMHVHDAHSQCTFPLHDLAICDGWASGGSQVVVWKRGLD